uniref:Cytochrome b5 reductase-like n=1 Tax=Mus musculus TaxID=10090 RepID=F2Z4B1_MOUSE
MAETEEEEDSEAWLRLKPVEPLPSQCCGSGCSPCVFDLYYRDLERWETARARNDRSLLSGKQPPESQISIEYLLYTRPYKPMRICE